ncbi:MAG: hypothetical protein SPE16_05445 [Butyricicoccus porcorum]|nr:hypothetical protein [Butyricicoccus porcorum]
MLKREIEIDGMLVPFRASATIPRLYRAKFKHDIFKDLAKLQRAYATSQAKKSGENDDADFEFEIDDLELFENIAYIMAYHADNTIPPSVEDWLERFNVFSIYEVLPQLLGLWGENISTEVKSKKELAGVNGK